MLMATPPFAPLPMYQILLLDLLAPPIGAAALCLRFRIRHTLSKGLQVRQIARNTSDWFAFAAFTAAGYLVMFGITIYALYQRH